jgi:antitoxin HicB
MSKKNMGSSIDDFLKQEGIFEDAQAQAVKEVVAWQLSEAMKKNKISKSRMAALLKTSRTQVDRRLDPEERYYSFQPAAGGCGGPSRDDRASVKPCPVIPQIIH